MNHFKYGGIFDYKKYVEAYNRLQHTANEGARASESKPQAGGHEAQPRSRPVAGELQPLHDLRPRDAAKPRSPRATGKSPGSASPSAEKTPHTPVPFEEQVKQDFDRWLTGGAPTAQRAQAAARMEYAELERERTLKLDGLALGRIPAKLGQFKGLQKLWIGGNQLDHLPTAVCRLERLLELDARDNLMTELPSTIRRLTLLRRLNVDGNQLELLPNELAQLTELEMLSARSNQLTLVPAKMSALKKLRTLDISHNQLWSIPGTWRALFQLLEHVDLSHNRLQQLPATLEAPVRKMKLNVSENPSMATLPSGYSGFRYANRRITAADDHKLTNVDGKVTVNTKGTSIRQGLVNEARLAPGRGIAAQGAALVARNRPLPFPLHDGDRDSISSELSFARDHAEPGEIEGLEHVWQGAEADDTWGERRLEAWVEPLAERYAARHVPAAAPEPEPEPEPAIDPWESARADLFDMQRTVARPPALPAAPQLRPDFLSALRADLARLPEPQASAIAGYLNSLPQPMLAAALTQLQNGSWSGIQAGIAGGQASVSMFGAAPATAPARANDAEAAWFASDLRMP